MKIFAIGAELRLKKSLDIVENYMTEALEGRKEAPSDDLLSRFMKKRDIDGNLFPNTVLKRIALNFVLAGRDTSSVALSWFFWSVMTNPHVEYKILDEITTILRETRGENLKLWTEEPLAFESGTEFSAEIVVETIDENGVGTVRGEYMACSPADEQCDDHRREGTQLNECLNEITRALLQADVQFKLVRDMQTNIKKTVNLDDLAAGHNKRKIIQLNSCLVRAILVKFVKSYLLPFLHRASLNGVEVFMNTSGSHHQLRKLDLRLRNFIGATHSRGGVYMYSNHQGCDGGRLYYDGCSCVVVNGDVVAQGSQFSLKDVEVVVAQIDLDARFLSVQQAVYRAATYPY
ncbi:Cytochrome P450 86A1 [Camellia lanceoleosa]|uniref:Cytochrome P450 86A1 n=1 Tax=Camellia lanceoleosa TaxID=1840588 RepID=A0ACC0FBH9_9ERIC|nr:Cytochrome P450 86A1 [Camellia lanceoleosa]